MKALFSTSTIIRYTALAALSMIVSACGGGGGGGNATSTNKAQDDGAYIEQSTPAEGGDSSSLSQVVPEPQAKEPVKDNGNDDPVREVVDTNAGTGDSNLAGGDDRGSLPANKSAGNIQLQDTGSVTLGWTAPVARTDGSALALSEIAGYTVHYGTTPGKYRKTVKLTGSDTTSVTIDALLSGTYYMVVSTRDSGGRQSEPSEEVVKTVSASS